MSGPRISGRQLAAIIDGIDAGPGPRYLQIAEAIRLSVVDGRLTPGTGLPSERELTEALGVSRTTVTRAYDRVRELGFLTSRRGSGSAVRRPPSAGAASAAVGVAAGRPGPESDGPVDLTFTAVSGVPELFSWYSAAAAAMEPHLLGHGCAPLGLADLREAVAARFCARGLPTTCDQIVVTTGGLSGVAAVLQAIVDVGDRVLLENPGYPGTVRAARMAGARLIGWPVEPRVDRAALVALLRQTAPRAAVITADFHNPTGRYLTADERRDVGAAFTTSGTVAIVDETLLETRLDSECETAPPFAAFARGAFTVGSISKSHWSGIRVGWVRAPRDHVDRVLQARAGLDLGASVLEQVLVARLLSEGRHVLESMLERSRKRRAEALTAVRTQLPEWQVESPQGGLVLWCRLPTPGASALVERCAAHGVLLAPGSAFGVDGLGFDRFVRLPFTVSTRALLPAIEIIAEQWRSMNGVGPSREVGPARAIVS